MNKKLISEELKRHRQLLEYQFIANETMKDGDDELLLDVLNEQDPTAGDEPELELPPLEPVGDETGNAPTEDTVTDLPLEDTTTTEEPLGGDVDPFATEDEPALPIEDEMAPEDGTVEVDVTDLVDKTDQTKTSVDGLTGKMDELLSKLAELENQVSGMDNVINKIDDLEKEIEKRNPTPVERLEMRSLSSYPYSVKLTDFWADKEGYETEEPEEEFVLTQGDVENFDKNQIKSSFDSSVNNEDDEY
jgi:hypothetical protein